VRLIPGVLGNFESALADSHVEKILGTPVYTRPETYEGFGVPEELISGNHKEIENFRRREALKKTYYNRPELLDDAELGKEEKSFLDKLKKTDNNKNE
jgi:tRNA (guanine37-N1)-methyltransferase